MRNVTIVESNVEPNKEHLWFYNGKLKWFGPNGWEEIYSQASSPTTTPKPVVPPATTTTSTAPGPVVATQIGVRVYNYMDITIDTIVFGANSVNRYIPANEDVYIEGVHPSTSGGNITLYIKARGSGSTSSGAQVNRFLDVNIMGEISGTSIEQFKSILNEGTIDIPYTGSDALHSISLVVSISDGDTTTTTTTSSSTPAPITEQEILVSNSFIGEDGPTFGITMDDNINFNNVVPSRLQTLEEGRETYVTYTPSSRYLAVVSPKTNGFKDTIVATILIPVDGSFDYEGHTLYPINSMDNESSKYFLFDLSKSPYVGTAAYSNPRVELHNYNSHSISSIPPFIDGNIPPFADEK